MSDIYVDVSGGGDYTSLKAAYASLSGALTEIVNIYCSGGVDTVPCAAGTDFTPSSDYYVHVIGDGTYSLVVDNDNAIIITSRYNWFENIWFEIGTVSVDDYRVVRANGRDSRFTNCVMKSNTESYNCSPISILERYVTVENCILWDAGDSQAVIDYPAADANYIYNCTIIGLQAFYDLGGNMVLKNNIFYVSTRVTNGAISTECDYNTTNFTSCTDGAHDQISQTFSFVDESNGDFHLAAEDTGARGFGIGPSGDALVPATDKDGVTRPSATCDCGAYEYVSAISYWHRARGFNGGFKDGGF